MRFNPYLLAELGIEAYKNKLSHKEWENRVRNFVDSRSTFTNLEFFFDNDTQTQAFGVQYGSVAIICFPGTEDPLDFLTDLQANLVEDPEKNYHTGIWVAYCSIQKQIAKYINSATITEVLAVGHSLGGGLAKIAALEIPQVTTCITFGAPPISGSRLSLRTNLIVVQFINEADIVPRCMAVGAAWCPPLIRFLDSIQSHNKTNFLGKMAGFFESVLTNLQPDLKEYSLFGEVILLDIGGIPQKLTEPVYLQDILSKAIRNDVSNAITHHMMSVYKSRLETMYKGLPFILDEDEINKAHITEYSLKS